MKIREVDSRLTEVLQGTFGHAERSEGLHASRIIHDLRAGLGKLKKGGGISDVQLEEFGTIGFVWERVLETTLAKLVSEANPARYLRLGEQVQDGVYRTPDYADLDHFGDGTYKLGVEEWKCSWSSYRKADDLERNFWHWLVQIKDYCEVLNTPYARLRALFIAGDWKGDITPKLRTWEMEFSARELRDNHDMLLNHAKRKGWV
jgi:hypothetical protein